ncbi:MAG: MurR/RpiR family transcriptional regulator, partial [Armatimonadota bacterium]|nr:MurR/RpiR family transcriptional regulator [Armatimonadota bacterium]
MGAPPVAGGCWLRLRELASSLAEAERRVADYVVREGRRVPALSITELAERCGVSEATVVRVCKRLGLRGYQELRIRLSAELAAEQPQIVGEVRRGDGVEEACRKLFAGMVA